METESNPILLNKGAKKEIKQTEIKLVQKPVDTKKKEEKEPDMMTRLRMLKKLKSDLELVKKKESNGMEEEEPPKKIDKKKESIMQKLLESKRKKMMIKEKYETVNGKKSEVIKEYNESEEESVSKSNNETPVIKYGGNDENSGLDKINEFNVNDNNNEEIENNNADKEIEEDEQVEKEEEKEEPQMSEDTLRETEQKKLIKEKLRKLALEKQKLKEKMEENKNIPLLQRKPSQTEEELNKEKEDIKEETETPKEIIAENGSNQIALETKPIIEKKSSKSELKSIIEILKAKSLHKEETPKEEENDNDKEEEDNKKREKEIEDKKKKDEEELKTIRLKELEEQKKKEEEEEEYRKEVEERKRKEQEQIAELKRREELRKQQEAERRLELERIAEEKRIEELKRKEEERIAELKRQEEQRKKEELALEAQRKQDELRRKKEERKKREEARKLEEKRIQEELKRIEEVKKLEIQLLEEKLNNKPSPKKNSLLYVSKKSEGSIPNQQQPYQRSNLQLPEKTEDFTYVKRRQQKHFSQEQIQDNSSYPRKVNTDSFGDINRISTYQKPVRVTNSNLDFSTITTTPPSNVIYAPKKPGMRGRSIDRFNTSELNDISNYQSNNISTISKARTQNYNKYQYDDVSYFNNYSSTPYNNNENDNSFQINLEDLMILEEKLSEAITALEAKKFIQNECFEWWNYYYNCSLYNRIELIFKDEKSRHIVQMSIKYELFSLLICYDVSSDNFLMTQIIVMIQAILNLHHSNLIVICEYVLSKISIDNLNNVWVYKLRNLVNSHDSGLNYMNSNYSYVEKINLNTNSIINYIRIILRNYPNNPKRADLMNLYKNIETISYQEINDIFQDKFMIVENPNSSVLASVVLRQNGQFHSIEPPYLKSKNIKPYTLVLDLDETIIHFRVNPNNELEGVMKVRPGIFDFLETLGQYYEMIVFTTATSEYADILLDSIEENKIYFDYRFYREHSIIIDNDFVKDLTRIGRPLDKTIIVDNMPQNFRLQKENGIIIKGFFGDDPYDSALIELTPILLSIAKEGGDVRKSLARYRDDILKKVTSNMSRQIK